MIRIYSFLLLLVFSTAAFAQLTVINSGGDVVMQVDNQANVTVGSATQTGALTTHTLTILNGAADGRVLKSNASGLASWGTDQVDDDDADPTNEFQTLNLSGTTLQISDGNSVTLPTGSDNQQLGISGHTLSLDRGGSVTLPDNVNDADHVIGNEFPLSGNSITVSGDRTVNHADNSSQSSVNNSGRTVIQDVTLDAYGHVTSLNSSTLADNVNDADHDPTNEYQDLGNSVSGENVTVSITDGSSTTFSLLPAMGSSQYQVDNLTDSEFDLTSSWQDVAAITGGQGVYIITAQIFGDIQKQKTTGYASIEFRIVGRVGTLYSTGAMGRCVSAFLNNTHNDGSASLVHTEHRDVNGIDVKLQARISTYGDTGTVTGKVYGSDHSAFEGDTTFLSVIKIGN